MAKKSKAQINRMIKRAEARGQVYEPPPSKEGEEVSSTPSAAKKEQTVDDTKQRNLRVAAARQLVTKLQHIEKDTTLKAKERRSAKRRAEAIAAEAVGCAATELLEWYNKQAQQQQQSSTKQKASKSQQVMAGEDDGVEHRKKNPYIAFFGQLSFQTTAESLLQHIQESLAKDEDTKALDVSDATVQIRLLTDVKTKRSRGMAFVQVTTPELLYALLRLHQTYLEGRRINVERTAGGKGQHKRQKLQEYRKEQDEYVSGVVDKMLADCYTAGTIQPDELDEGVISLLKRHSSTVVQAALERYVESEGRFKDNPNAYLTCLVGKMASEGIFDQSEDNRKKPPMKKPRVTTSRQESVFAEQGVDMTLSNSANDGGTTTTFHPNNDMARIFPSLSSRGRGRGGRP